MQGLWPDDVVVYGSYYVGLFSTVLLGETVAWSTGESYCCSLNALLTAAGIEGRLLVRKGGLGRVRRQRRSAAPLTTQDWSAPLFSGSALGQGAAMANRIARWGRGAEDKLGGT